MSTETRTLKCATKNCVRPAEIWNISKHKVPLGQVQVCSFCTDEMRSQGYRLTIVIEATR